MYKEFYGLKEIPFNLTPDPDFLYLSKAHQKAMAYLKYGLETRKGIIQLTGEIGSGKTTLLKSILAKNRNKIK
ncbi:MAG: GTP-binding protein, partial [Planctomycetota bacterium]